MSDGSGSRLPGIDALRIFGAVLVVGLHVGLFPEWPHALMEVSRAMSRWVVPFFFLVMGFFIGQRALIGPTALVTSGRLLQITLVCTVLYGVLNLLQLGLRGGVERMISPEFIVRGAWGHLWFMHAALAGLLLAAARPDWWQPRAAWWGIGVVLLGCSGLDSMFAMGRIDWPTMFASRFLSGVAMVWLGIKLASVPREALARRWPVLLVAGLVLMVLQALAVRFKGGEPAEMQLHVGAVVLGVAALALGLALPASAGLERLAGWGRRYALGLYLLHPMIIELLRVAGVRRSDVLWLGAAVLTLLLLWASEHLFPKGKAVLDGR
ncbi:Surface polysaccharide O-acyltransferase, integral membrane enzyme [Roseateles sp. YR242]|uniref:acyltransferase family protein n=1 Tax=Roseateles sp. YR242 TaxID=1855305 RepID=UPI0008B4EC59|nr:acyltransferase family protein [Roseateles sp. YR242]SEK52419.1 Surface polysaccharide O-acyltransferase, integral membrane enzyme [Roseateles sp. YR242]